VSDKIAVIEARAPSAPGSGDSVGDLVRVADDASAFSRVVRVERLAPVPGVSDTAGTAERAATRDAEAERAAADASVSPFASLMTLGGRLQWTVGVGVAVAVTAVALYLLAPFQNRGR
jgi:hypothetical protein